MSREEGKPSARNKWLPTQVHGRNKNRATPLDTANMGQNSADQSRHLDYWKNQLTGDVPRLQLPFDRARTSDEAPAGSVEEFELPSDLVASLRRVAGASADSLRVTLLTGVAALLQRYSGQDDMILGSSLAGNAAENSESRVALRLNLAGNPTFAELQSRVSSLWSEADAHSALPFSEVLKAVRPNPDSSEPLFSVAVDFVSGGAAAATFSGSVSEDLKFSFEDRGATVRGSIVYATDIFDRGAIVAMAGHLLNLVTAASADPDRRISEIGLLTESESKRILRDWNETSVAFPDVCTHDLFQQQAAKTPELVAVKHRGQTLTYRELNERANQLAHFLQKRGVGPEVLVGVSLNRTPEMVIALLATWKSGGAYVPLDPAYPQDRLSYMLEDSAAKYLLTSSDLKHLFPNAAGKTIFVDSGWSEVAAESTEDPASSSAPSNLAYVMYTSGSTGAPKGAMILHSGLVNYLTWAIGAYGVEAGRPVPVHSSISFDLTVTSLYPALLAGGYVELLPEDVGAQNLIAALKKPEHRSLVKITPAHLELLSQQLSSEESATVTKTFVIGGEALLAENLVLWREFAPETRLVNEYGPTETVVGCCVHEVRPTDPKAGPVAIGRPIANTQLYILDAKLQPVPAGVKGELYIGGAGVARGYFNRPDLTEKKFIPDPFSGKPGARLYKSGDLARYRQDGILEYLGRADDQVKVRGYRIELGEIEAALAAHPSVQTCTVLALEETPGNKQLVAYAVPQPNRTLAVDDLKTFLKQSLPEYMVPSQFVFLESFPLTRNGKIDRKALPAPTHASISAAHEFVAPTTETEKKVAAMWEELLKAPRIGIHDDFFDLGGHSLMAIKALSRIREEFGVDLPLATLLQAPTVAKLSALLHKEDFKPSWSLLVPIRTGGSKPPLFLMHAHGGNVLDYHPLVNHLDSDQPVYAFQARGLDGNLIKDATLPEMAAAYVAELRAFQPEGPYFLGGFCLGGLLALEAAEQLVAAGQKVSLVMMVQSIHPEAMDFKPRTAAYKRFWYRLTKRVRLEAENFSNGRKGYLMQRIIHLADVLRVRASIAYRDITGKNAAMTPELSKLYFFEALGVEHKKAMDQYRPAPFDGDVVVFRAKNQLKGLIADQYLGWKNTVRGNLEMCDVPGHQQNVMLEPNVSQLAKELSLRLKAAHQKSTKIPRGRTARERALKLATSK